MNIETTALYRKMKRRISEVPAGPPRLLDEFERLRTVLQEHGKYIVLLFPEYTPHDHTRHLDHLFALADRVLSPKLYARINSSELILLAFGLYAHDWGMAVSEAERKTLESGSGVESFTLLPNEPSRAREFISEAITSGVVPEVAWRDYLRRTHGLRSGVRLRQYLGHLGTVFADAVAKIAEGHTLDIRDVRDVDRYPLALPMFGETVNLAALTTYVRMIDLLDIGEDRTPYALWKFVAPADPISKMEWQKHRALSPVAVIRGSVSREVVIGGLTDDPAVFAALADLRSWIDEQFSLSMAQLRMISGKYDLDLDSRISWSVQAGGFEPVSVRFELSRSEVLSLLSSELYRGDPLAFIRELLQNSVDAIDMREALHERQGLILNGEIKMNISSNASGLSIEWSDNGIGMDAEVLSSYFARLGISWYRSRDANRIGKIEAISQFGVGVLSCFAITSQLRIETRRDPQAGGSPPGLSIDVPTRDSHFRIRTATGLPVGTTIRMQVAFPLAAELSGKKMCEALSRIARYVRHRVVIGMDGVTTEVRSLANRDIKDDENDDLKITVLGVHDKAGEKLVSLTSNVIFEFGELGSDYHGFYSVIVPKRPSKAIKIDYKTWRLEGENIDFLTISLGTEQSLFVKGIQTGPVGQTGRGARDSFREGSRMALARHTDWIQPKLLLNLRHPSFVEFNLARSSARLQSKAWLVEVWREIANKLRTNVFFGRLDGASNVALMLGSCAVFGGVPDSGLDALVEANEIPLLVLRPTQGLVWTTLAEFTHAGMFIEAPFELNYANSGEIRGFERNSGLAGWEGDEALFPIGTFSPNRYPWLEPVLSFGKRTLIGMGWRPLEIQTVRPASNENLPLVCRVWRKVADNHFKTASETGAPKVGPPAYDILKSLFGDAPEVFSFPKSVSKYAAIGSRYWNIDHPKIERIVSALTLLAQRRRENKISADRSKVISYLVSNDYYGYLVPSRKSGKTLAIELPNRLMTVAEEEGMGHAERLIPSDFVPCTIDRYENPYHYDLRAWKILGTGLGRRVD